MSLATHLPLDLILQIIETSLPPGGPHRIVNPTTPDGQVLVAWTQVCRATYSFASRLLREHCVYLDSIDRLERLSQCLSAEKAREASNTLPPTLPLSGISSIYLGLHKNSTRWVRPWAVARDLFVQLGGSVRRMIFMTPFHSLYTASEGVVRMNELLYEGFSALKNLEEFVSMGGLHCLSHRQRYVDMLQHWPKLKRLAGCYIDVGEMEFWQGIATARTLEHVVLVCPVFYRDGKFNVKRAVAESWREDPGCARRISIVSVTGEAHGTVIDYTDEGGHDPGGLISAFHLQITKGDNQWSLVQRNRHWMTEGAMQGTLWTSAPAECAM